MDQGSWGNWIRGYIGKSITEKNRFEEVKKQRRSLNEERRKALWEMGGHVP